MYKITAKFKTQGKNEEAISYLSEEVLDQFNIGKDKSTFEGILISGQSRSYAYLTDEEFKEDDLRELADHVQALLSKYKSSRNFDTIYILTEEDNLDCNHLRKMTLWLSLVNPFIKVAPCSQIMF